MAKRQPDRGEDRWGIPQAAEETDKDQIVQTSLANFDPSYLKKNKVSHVTPPLFVGQQCFTIWTFYHFWLTDICIDLKDIEVSTEVSKRFHMQFDLNSMFWFLLPKAL